MLISYPWPGNIRELENVIERAVVLSNQPVLTEEDLPAEIRHGAAQEVFHGASENEPFLVAETPPLEEVKKRYVLRVLGLCKGNVSQAARTLNIDRRSLYRMLVRYKVDTFSKS